MHFLLNFVIMRSVIKMNKKEFRKDLLLWYQKNKRDLPWRKTTNPYYIWLSEIMLQQTQVQTVIPYYLNFIKTFPTIKDLATASLEDVYKCWEGLGYYSRARNLQFASNQIISQFDGIFPQNYDDILTLKGIGPYTAAAISSIAFQYPKGVVDGNVLRILSRVYEKEGNIALDKTKKEFQILCDDLIDTNDPSSFNQALMDLGATICKPQNPLCDTCPIQKHCQAFKHQKQGLLPINIKKINHQEINYITGLIYYEDQLFLLKNPDGLLSGLYGLPQYNVESPNAFEETFNEEYNENIEIYSFQKMVKHVFTHRTWKMYVYLARFTSKPNLSLYSLEEIDSLPISTAHKKVIKLIQ